MQLTHTVKGSKVVGVLQEETPSSWHLKPVEYMLTSSGDPIYRTSPDGLWFHKTTWEM